MVQFQIANSNKRTKNMTKSDCIFIKSLQLATVEYDNFTNNVMLSITINKAEHVCATVIIKHLYATSRPMTTRKIGLYYQLQSIEQNL